MNEEQLNIEFEEQQPTHGKRVYVYFALLVFAILFVFGVKAQWQQHVPVREVVVEGISIISKDEVIRLMKIPPHTSMYELDLMVLQQNIMANSFVRHAVVTRDAPMRLRVEIEERKPAAILAANELQYIDEDGIFLPYISTTETYDIPVISGIDSVGGLKAGQKLSHPEVQEALEIIRTAKIVSEDLFHSISEIRLHKGHDKILYSFETGVPIIFGSGDVVKKMVKLDAFRQKFLQNSDTKNIQYIDIRYDDQIVISRKITS